MAYIDKDKIPYYLDTSEEAPMEGRKIAFKSDVDKIPTADVEEVKHGEWVTVYSENGYHKECSVCGSRWMFDSKEHVCKETKRCYECGAKMGGRK